MIDETSQIEHADTSDAVPAPGSDDVAQPRAESAAATPNQPNDGVLLPITERLNRLEQVVEQLAANVGALVERADLLPRQVRQLGNKVDEITESISQPRIRDLLGSLLL